MSIDLLHFTPWTALAGGVFIGLAAALYLFANGRIAGIAGIVSSPLRALMTGSGLQPHADRLLFVSGLLLAPWAWRAVSTLPAPVVDVSTTSLVAAGLLVGIGVRMGNGCTSGHGVCGLSRLSPRSLANVLAFMGAGVVTVFVLRHVFGDAL